MTDAWQPIESAPKDGTRILLYYTPRYWPGGHRWVIGSWDHDGHGWYMAGQGVIDDVAAWMPLPSPPLGGGSGSRRRDQAD